MFLMNEEEEKTVRGAAVESFDDLIKVLGPAFIDQNLHVLKEGIMKLLEAEIEEDVSDDEQEP